MAPIDRKATLLAHPTLTGIDFVAVHGDQVTLDVFFFHDASRIAPAVTAADFAITGEDEPAIPITGLALVPVDGREVVQLTVARPGGFGRYWLTLALDTTQIDPFFARIEVDFKAACERKVDCAALPHECPPAEPDDIVVDPAARDFWSLRRALLDFASLRHPGWKDRLEADAGVMLVELLAATGDDLAYYQDRVGREAQFGSASQRRSVRRHVRLVDYGLHDGLGARGHVAITSSVADWRTVRAGTPVWASGDGTAIGYEVGEHLDDTFTTPVRSWRAHAGRNRLGAHVWDDDVPDLHAPHRPLPGACLPVGSTSLHLAGKHADRFVADEQVFLITEPPPDERDLPVRALLVTLTGVLLQVDPLAASPDVTRLTWREPTPVELDLAWTFVLGNVAPVTAGITRRTTFSIGANLGGLPTAIERVGANQSIGFLHSLPTRGPTPTSAVPGDGIWRFLEDQAVVRLGDDPREAIPEVALHEVASPTAIALGQRWDWRPSLVGPNSSESQDRHFVLDDGTWERAIGFQRPGGEVVHRDYLTGTGATIRFGDGELGRMPPRGNAAAGQEIFYRATYRLGNGVRGNLPDGVLRHADPTTKLSYAELGPDHAFIAAVTNPLPIAGGVEAETIAQARRDAPEEFRAVTYRAVRPEDFDDAARRLPWVQQAGTQFRWTGSWSTAFTAADPRALPELPADQRRALGHHLDRFRMTGREVHVRPPRYADLELELAVCVEAHAYPADVVAGIVRALLGRRGLRPIAGFFDPDRFTFGTPLDRSELEVWVQRVPGVRAVKRIAIERRGWFPKRSFAEPYYTPGADEVIRVSGDPRHPDRGTLTILPEGGA